MVKVSSPSKAEKEFALTELRATAELISLFHDSDISLTTRTVYMGSALVDADGGESGCDARMAENVIKNLHVLESLGNAPIKIIMNNCGGNVYHGLAIYDAIRLSPCHITVVVRGYAMSMGSIILQAAAHRVMGPNAVQMIHYGTDAIAHHSKTVIKQAMEGERINRWMEGMYLARIHERSPNFTLAQLKALLDHDTFLTSNESVGLGLADEVG